MSRSGYTDGYCEDQWAMICWRGAVKSAMRGRRGQALLREMAAALDAMPIKRLIAHEIVGDGGVCALGAVAVQRGLDVSDVEPEDREAVADLFGIAEALAAEIAYENDECGRRRYVPAPDPNGRRKICIEETPEERWSRMRAWVRAALGD